MRRPQFTLRALPVLLLAVACFFGGIRFEREWQRRVDEANRLKMMQNFQATWTVTVTDLRPHLDEDAWRDLFSRQKGADSDALESEQ